MVVATFKRKVFYLGGFDPRGARFYHDLTATQVAAHNAAGGRPALVMGARRKCGSDGAWDVSAQDGSFVSEFRFLVWDDLVRAHWIKGALPLLRHMAGTYWRFWRTSDWSITGDIPAGSKFTLVYPGASMAILPLVCVLLFWAILVGPLHLVGLGMWWGLVPALAAGLIVGLEAVKRIHSMWLLRFIIFNDMLARDATAPDLQERLDRFAASIAEALDSVDAVDEVLFVTHSNGSILSMPVMARLLEKRGGVLPERFSLVTLGSSIPLLGIRRDAVRYHADCDRVAAGMFRWLDIGSLTDGASIPLVAPLLGRSIERPQGLIQLSPRWFRYCDPASYRLRRRDKYLTHFDYLRRLDRPSPLDYLGLTCTARPLAESIAAFEAENA